MKTSALRLLIVILTAIYGSLGLVAQPPQSRVLSPGDRQKYVTEIRTYKHDYLTKTLQLTKAQEKEFYPLYDELEDKIMALHDQARDVEHKTMHAADVSDIELETAARNLYSQKLKEGELELEYYLKFKDILTSKQLISLKNAERKFMQQLMRQQRKAKHHKHDSKKD